ncbi:type I secretion system permease/ATPase [Rhizobium straminoryzae]|uniref:Type I secretion system permease/ATPase n=1 Tax=Rhizobium straminoryzae TaxID=1387186 RepID=A0A549TFJ1_9HYPH|nr:type I secretion system permease/ATPase [Rhizobium straminoryzae]TRL41273.1 type I secretion system permease/ATPase [Rhizobium straminoryzae]
MTTELPDSGAWALALVLHLNGIVTDPLRLWRDAGKAGPFDVTDVLRSAKGFPVKARRVVMTARRLERVPFPAILCLIDGSFAVAGKYVDGQVLVQFIDSAAPRLVPVAELMERTSGQFILLAKRAPVSDLARQFNLGWFLSAAAKYRFILGEVFFASFVLQLFALATPLIFQTVIDKVLVHRGYETLTVMVCGLALIALFDAVLSGLRTWLFAHTSNRMDVELGSRLFKHLVRLPLSYFEARRVGDSVARVRELETIRQFMTSTSMTLVLDLLFGTIFIGVMFLYSSTLAWIVTASLPLYALLSLSATPAFRKRLDEKFRRGAENQAFLVESITGIETIKAMAVEPHIQNRWEEQLSSYVSASFSAAQLGNGASQVANLLNKGLTALILYIGAGLVIANRMTVGELVAFNMLAGQVSGPILRLVQVWQDFHQVRLSVDRLGDILNTPVEPQGATAVSIQRIDGDIRFEDVTFRYAPGGRAVVRGLDLRVRAGQVVGIVGPSGSGKSTLAKLVQRLYQPESGRILIDDIDISLLDPAVLRRQIGVVLQDNILFNRTIRENIALADPTMSLERVMEAARMAGAHDFIAQMPLGYDTKVGERGVSMSGGQRQRIAIARALAGNPRILIFDEATSALDSESEAAIQANMSAICKGRTVLIIAHRLSTVRRADRILTIEEGCVVEDGTHETLVAGDGRYSSLFRLQAGLR